MFVSFTRFQNTLARLGKLRLTTSHVFLYKKLDEFGTDYDKNIRDAVSQQTRYMNLQRIARSSNCDSSNETQQVTPLTITAAAAVTESSSTSQLIIPDCGRKVTFDNLDYRHEVHYMTEENQNVDKHCVTVMATENRVPGCSLSDKLPENGILKMENGKCLPNHVDNIKQRENYIVLVERIMTNIIPCLQSLSDVTTSHIPHCYREKVCKKTETVSTFALLHINYKYSMITNTFLYI